MNLVYPIGAPAASRPRRRRYPRAAGIAALVLLALLALTDLLIAGAAGAAVRPTFLVLSLGLAAVLWPAARRPAWLTPQVRTAVPAGVSVVLTAVYALTGWMEVSGPGEVVLLLCLLMVAVRTCPPGWVRGSLDPVLADIEHAATEALASMRRTVGILREVPREGTREMAGPELADRHPAADLSAVTELVEGFGGFVGPKALLHRDPAVGAGRRIRPTAATPWPP